MKDKPARNAKMIDLLDEYQSQSPKQKQVSMSNETAQEELWSQDELQQIKTYNENITNLDELYKSIQPINGYVVRVFLFEPQDDSGVLIPYKQLVSVPTQNNMAEYAEIESPYPYSNRAIIVASPPTSQFLKAGDIVQLANNPVKPQVQGRGHNATVAIPSAYIHPDANTFQIPTKPNEQHYGYLFIPIHEIIAKL